MIKMINDPILGVRYITDCVDPRTESQPAVYAKAKKQFSRELFVRAKQFRHGKNTKQK